MNSGEKLVYKKDNLDQIIFFLNNINCSMSNAIEANIYIICQYN